MPPHPLPGRWAREIGARTPGRRHGSRSQPGAGAARSPVRQGVYFDRPKTRRPMSFRAKLKRYLLILEK
ncbi:MAG: hypothetical protein KDB96_16890, partial [Flavobacteriales bacterium]|nr:hypothetical protein [Flavobacteriales bacterium]